MRTISYRKFQEEVAEMHEVHQNKFASSFEPVYIVEVSGSKYVNEEIKFQVKWSGGASIDGKLDGVETAHLLIEAESLCNVMNWHFRDTKIEW